MDPALLPSTWRVYDVKKPSNVLPNIFQNFYIISEPELQHVASVCAEINRVWLAQAHCKLYL